MFRLFGRKKADPAAGQPRWPWPENVLTREKAYGLIQLAVRLEGVDAKVHDPQIPDSLDRFVKTIEQHEALKGLWAEAVRAAVEARASRRKQGL